MKKYRNKAAYSGFSMGSSPVRVTNRKVREMISFSHFLFIYLTFSVVIIDSFDV